jgi:hypothetical protein
MKRFLVTLARPPPAYCAARGISRIPVIPSLTRRRCRPYVRKRRRALELLEASLDGCTEAIIQRLT